MANYTSNLNLEKPLQTELYNVDVFNANADKIDAGVGACVKYTDALTLEEIIASTDLTGKVTSASAAKSLKESLSNIGANNALAVGTAVSVPANTATLVGTASLPTSGTYIVRLIIRLATASAGKDRVRFGTSIDNVLQYDDRNAVANSNTVYSNTLIVTGSSVPVRVFLATQNTVDAWVQYVRIA